MPTRRNYEFHNGRGLEAREHRLLVPPTLAAHRLIGLPTHDRGDPEVGDLRRSEEGEEEGGRVLREDLVDRGSEAPGGRGAARRGEGRDGAPLGRSRAQSWPRGRSRRPNGDLELRWAVLRWASLACRQVRAGGCHRCSCLPGARCAWNSPDFVDTPGSVIRARGVIHGKTQAT